MLFTSEPRGYESSGLSPTTLPMGPDLTVFIVGSDSNLV